MHTYHNTGFQPIGPLQCRCCYILYRVWNQICNLFLEIFYYAKLMCCSMYIAVCRMTFDDFWHYYVVLLSLFCHRSTQCLNCLVGGWGLNPHIFAQPPPNDFCLAINPQPLQLFSDNSNTASQQGRLCVYRVRLKKRTTTKTPIS